MFKFKSYDLGLVLISFGLIAVVAKSDKALQVIDITSDMTILRPISAQTGNQPNSLITSIQEEKETADESYFQNKFESRTLSCPDGGLKGLVAHRLGIVFTTVFQHLDGPQLETDWYRMVG